MPFYEYRCTACGHQDSFLESFSAPQQKTCPQCRKRRAFKRLVSAAGFQLKGSGWYVTDFKNKDKPAAKKGGDGKVDSAEKSADKPAEKSADKGKRRERQERRQKSGRKEGRRRQKQRRVKS